MAEKFDYRKQLKQEFEAMFGSLELKDRQRHYLKSRWLDQVLWMEGRASRARDLHYRLRLTTIIGGVIIPALVSFNFTGSDSPQVRNAIAVSTFVLSQVVAISAATEQFFNYGDRWRHYRRGVESLKTQGWQFFELSGIYQPYSTHDQAFRIFAGQVESILQQDVEVYATQVAQSKKDDNDDDRQEPDFSSQQPDFNPPTAPMVPPRVPPIRTTRVSEPIDEAMAPQRVPPTRTARVSDPSMADLSVADPTIPDPSVADPLGGGAVTSAP
jgi:hypothetical protein